MSNCEVWTTIIGVIIAILFVAIVILVFYFYKTYKETRKHFLDLTKYEINCRTPIDASIPHILDLIIDDCFSDYQIIVLIPKNEGYITEVREKEIRDDLIYKVTERLSPEAIEKMSILYNVKNIDKVIADKIYITVMNYCIDHNRTISTTSNIKNNETSL